MEDNNLGSYNPWFLEGYTARSQVTSETDGDIVLS
jgi:hypothetical protein